MSTQFTGGWDEDGQMMEVLMASSDDHSILLRMTSETARGLMRTIEMILKLERPSTQSEGEET